MGEMTLEQAFWALDQIIRSDPTFRLSVGLVDPNRSTDSPYRVTAYSNEILIGEATGPMLSDCYCALGFVIADHLKLRRFPETSESKFYR